MPEHAYNCSMTPVLQGSLARVTSPLADGIQRRRALKERSRTPIHGISNTVNSPFGPVSQPVLRAPFELVLPVGGSNDRISNGRVARTSLLSNIDGSLRASTSGRISVTQRKWAYISSPGGPTIFPKSSLFKIVLLILVFNSSGDSSASTGAGHFFANAFINSDHEVFSAAVNFPHHLSAAVPGARPISKRFLSHVGAILLSVAAADIGGDSWSGVLGVNIDGVEKVGADGMESWIDGAVLCLATNRCPLFTIIFGVFNINTRCFPDTLLPSPPLLVVSCRVVLALAAPTLTRIPSVPHPKSQVPPT
ncbi:hypothetical protein K438DRAFT_1980325 [Mycena galopus ATCC 62051]|nr:hypothetical protein K438DRAFT_1980325 [Mycena galopus ATCC 62051]